MRLQEKLTTTITFVGEKAKEIKKFKEANPKTTHGEIYLKGMEALKKEEK